MNYERFWLQSTSKLYIHVLSIEHINLIDALFCHIKILRIFNEFGSLIIVTRIESS